MDLSVPVVRVKSSSSGKAQAPIVECAVETVVGCDVEREKALLRRAQASEDGRGRVKREPEELDVAAATEDGIKSEHNVYETESSHVEEHLQIGPAVLQPRHPPVARPECPEVKLEPQYHELKVEPRSPEGETSQEDLTSVCSAPATAAPLAVPNQIKRSRKPCLEVKLEPQYLKVKLEPQYHEVKVEPRSPEGETSQEDLTSVCSAPATAAHPAGPNQIKRSRKPYLEVKVEPQYHEVKLEPQYHELKLEPRSPEAETSQEDLTSVCSAPATAASPAGPNQIKRSRKQCLEVKLEPRSPEAETSQEDLTSVCSAPATAASPAGPNQIKRSRKRKGTTKKRVTCDICQRIYTSLDAFKIHMRVHTGETPFACTPCHVKFPSGKSLKRHMLKHTAPEKPFSCITCHLRCTDASSLNKHMRVHSGERPFSCTTCGAKFTQKANLTGHMRIHTGVKHSSCATCNVNFAYTAKKTLYCITCDPNVTQKTQPKTHTHAYGVKKPFSCTACDAKFSNKTNLGIHMCTHSGQEPFSCNEAV